MPRSAGSDFLRDVLDCLADAFTEVAAFLAVPQLDGFVFARARARGNCRAAHCAASKVNVHFDGWITAGIKDFPRQYFRDRTH